MRKTAIATFLIAHDPLANDHGCGGAMKARLKKITLIIAAVLLSMALLWFGFRLLLTTEAISTGQLFLIGCTATIGGVYVFSSDNTKLKLWGLGLIALGIYYFARTSGLIVDPWLLRILGAISVVAAATLFYSVLPKSRSPNSEKLEHPNM